MRILLYGINYAPELTGIGKYSGEMAAWLAGRGHDVRVVTAPPYYPEWKVHPGFRNAWSVDAVDGVTVHRCPLYVPAQPSTLKRLLHLLSFAFTSALALLRWLRWKPDVVVVVEPTLFCAPAALLYAKLTGARTVLHVQDYEVDAMFGLGLMGGGWLARVARAVDGWLMRRFDRVSTISQSMMRHAARKGVDEQRLVFFPNWVDTDFIRPDVDRQLFRQRWNIPGQTRVVLYAGNMGRKQGLELVLAAAERFRDRRDVLFVMVGDGAARAELEQQVRQTNLANVRFEPLQLYEDLPCLLALADVHLVVQRRGAADVVLPSKLTGILAAGGQALITAAADTELGFLVEQYPGIALRVEPEVLDEFCGGLNQALCRGGDSVNDIARGYALEYLSRDALLGKFESDIRSLCGHSRTGKCRVGDS